MKFYKMHMNGRKKYTRTTYLAISPALDIKNYP